MSFNPPQVAEWQWLDESCNLWYPWYTKGALEEISTWKLKDKKVFEYGGGRSTLWWAKKAYEVVTVERNPEFVELIQNSNIYTHHRDLNIERSDAREGIQEDLEGYVNIIDCYSDIEFDIIVVDDIFRYECIVKALTLPRPLILIVDNWQQDQVFICPAADELMKTYPGEFYIQEDHTNHEGHPWTTAIWHLT